MIGPMGGSRSARTRYDSAWYFNGVSLGNHMIRPIVMVGDCHLSDRQISTRVDDTAETCLEKFEWVLNYAASISADIICTGDMFTHTLFNNRTRYRLKKALRKYKHTDGWFWSISGNHCLSGNTMVLSSKGWCSLGSLVDQKVLLWDGIQFVSGEVQSYGVQKVVKLKFASGRELVCTPDHKIKVLTPRGFKWVEAKQLSTKDRVCVSLKPVKMRGEWIKSGRYFYSGHKNMTPYMYHAEWEDSLAYVVGVLLGDGYLHDRRVRGQKTNRGCEIHIAVGYADIDRGYYKTLCDCLDLLGLKYSYRQDKRLLTVGTVSIHSTSFYDFLIREVGWIGTDSYTKEIPTSVWRASESVKKQLLLGLVRSDGHWGEYRLRMTSSKLIAQVGLLANELGCVSHFSDKANEKSTWLPKENRFLNSHAHVYNVSFVGADWLFPGDTVEEVQVAPRGFQVDWSYYQREFYHDTKWQGVKGNVLLYERWLNKLGSTLGEYYAVDVVIGIDDVGEEEVFCPSVNYRHQFSANGIIVHNSGDVEDRNPASVIYRELGQFVLDGYINFLGCFDHYCRPYFLDRSLTNSPVIAGYSAYSNMNDSVVEAVSDKVIGLVCHHFIGQECFGDPLVVYPDDMKKVFPNLRFMIGGHDHAYHEPYTSRDGVYVVRPGSMMRTDSGESSKRIPCVEVLYPGTGEGFTPDRWETVPIACARPYEEVFYVEKKGVNAGSVNALDRFVRQMQEQTNVVMDINSAVKEQFALVPHEDKDMVKADLAAQGFMV